MEAPPTTPNASSSTPAEPTPYRLGAYGLFVLMIVYMLNFLDRQIVNIVAESIKADLHISDKQLGLITGLSFALLYTTLGIPLARLAERRNRVHVIGGSLLCWSGFTVACGLVNTLGGLLLTRIGVGMGEAGCLPAAHSMIAEYTPPARRARAISIFMVGSPLGVLLGMAMGGIVSEAYGWRLSFIIAGVPGVLLTGLLLATLKDPNRAGAGSRSALPPSLKLTMTELLGKPAYWLLTAGASFGALVTYAQGAFIASFFMRVHHDALAGVSAAMGPQAVIGVILGLILGIGGAIGMVSGGLIADHYGRGRVRGYAIVAAISCVTVAPMFLPVVLVKSFWLAVTLLIPAAILNTLWPGPLYASIQTIVSERSRATAAAISLLVTSLVGLGLGPVSVGAISDALSASMGPAEALRWALAVTPIVSLLAAAMFWLASRRPEANPP
ncbi:MFS transporter [Hydrocarboniphaga sp.]|uniref:spinster family MFS transporter n=1 Tax=Hydrocarboniphaga sp. TaxID=2033016 RepID=UPI0026043247|nr:MFS transporter [Hydrocarboniphaga sp.]